MTLCFELSRVSVGSVSGLTLRSGPRLHLGTMDRNSTPWSSGSQPPSIHLAAMVGTVAPTIFPRVGYSILSFLMFMNTVLTVFNNSLVIAVMIRNPSLLQPMNVFILSLAVSDLMIGLCGSLVVTITNYQGSFFIGHAACIFQGFAVNYFGLVSLWTLTLLAYERYNVVCKPRAGLKMSMRRSIIGLLFVWIFCLFWAVAPLFGWSSYGPEGVQTSCSLAWEERSWSNYSYLILYTLLCFILPVTVIIYCYSKVLKSMNRLNRSVELQGGRSSQKENEHAISMVLAMVIAFFVCWLPYTALSVVVVVDPELYIPPIVATMPMYFAKTSPVYNPIIYFLSNKQFRDAALEVLSCGRYIPHAPTATISINMRPLNRRSRLTSLSRSVNTHSKVLPL
ncbi:LOW QUALITY PROTEIN: parietopsin [Tautogolabrus adspersus]